MNGWTAPRTPRFTRLIRFRFDKRYFFLTALFFAIEVFIALFVRDSFIRPLVGDALVVVLIYLAVLSFADICRLRLSIWVFVFACCVETSQSFDLVAKLGWQDVRVLSVILGRTFSWLDLLAYLVGCVAVYWFDSKSKWAQAE